MLIRGYAVSPEGSEPQKLTSPIPEAADQAAAAIVMEFGSDRQKHLVGIAGQIGGLIERRRAERDTYNIVLGIYPDPQDEIRTAEEGTQLTPTQMAELGQKFDRVSGIMHRTVNPNPDDPEEMRLAREFDEADKVAAVGEYAFSPRVPTEEPKPTGKPPIGQPDEFTASELDIAPRVPAENSTGITIGRRVQLQYFLAGISGARGPQNDAERILLEEMAQEAEKQWEQSTRLSGLSGPSILLD